MPRPKKDIPTVICYEAESGVRFFCAYCGEEHKHGDAQGHRVAHCTNLASPYRATGYNLTLSKYGIRHPTS